MKTWPGYISLYIYIYNKTSSRQYRVYSAHSVCCHLLVLTVTHTHTHTQAIMAIRWGICSAGKISHDFTVALKTLPAENHQVLAVAARDLKHAQEFAQKHSVPRSYGSYEELAKDPEIGETAGHQDSGVFLKKQKKNKTFCILHVFVLQAVWTRFFPVSLEIGRLLSRGDVGEVKVVRADFGVPLTHVQRAVQKELGGGALLDIGIYCIQFVLMVFNGEKPETIQATGVCLDTGVDEAMVVTLKFSGQRLAVCTCTITAELPNEAVIVGTKGTIKVPAHMWCPTSLMVNGVETQYPVPEPSLPLNFINSTGMCYEAEEVRRCLLHGLKESSRMSHADSALLAEIMDEARRQVGVVYSQDSQ
uniref:Dihydrodiol dehydrogenase, tandem duplicate 2 n=1 Tax=Sinocyclocheilus grahami TaxID=75366 RepID=A0A672RVW0_SINGR